MPCRRSGVRHGHDQRIVRIDHRVHRACRSLHVISLFAAFRTSENVGSMQDVVKSLDNSIRHLRKIKTIASDNNKRLAKLTADNFTKASPAEIEEKRLEESQTIEEAHPECPAQAETSKNIQSATTSQATDSEATAPQTEQKASQSTAKPLTPREAERKAIAKIADLLGFSDIYQDFRLRGAGVTTVFDGMHEAPGMLSLFDVKYVNTAIFAEKAITMFYSHIKHISAKYDMAHTHFYLIIVFRYNNKQSFTDRHPLLPQLPNLTILYLNHNEL